MPNNLISAFKRNLTLGQFEKEIALLHGRFDQQAEQFAEQQKLLLEMLVKLTAKTTPKPKAPTQEK